MAYQSWFYLSSAVLFFLTQSGCTGDVPLPEKEALTKSAPLITLNSSADFGIVSAESGRTSRIVRIRNTTKTRIAVSHWKVSCECLGVVPGSCEIPAGESHFVALVFDPSKEGHGFTGDLSISVEAYSGDTTLARFTAPICIVSPHAVAHLDRSDVKLRSPDRAD